MRKPFDPKFDYLQKPDGYLQDIEYTYLGVLRVCPRCFTELYGTSYSTNSYKVPSLAEYSELQSCSKECPICGSELIYGPGYSFTKKEVLDFFADYPMYDLFFDDIFSDMSKKRAENIKTNAKTAVQEYIDKCNANSQEDSFSLQESILSIDLGFLKTYMQNALNLETSIYDLSARLEIIYEAKHKAEVDYISSKGEQLEILSDKIVDVKKSIIDLRKIDTSKIKYSSTVIYDEKPPKPIEPKFDIKQPQEPDYKKPNIFNKKKVLAENEIQKAIYEKALDEYASAKKQFEEALNKYKSEYNEYQIALKNYEKDCAKKDAIAKKEYDDAVIRYKEEIKQNNESKKKEIDDLKKQINIICSNSNNIGLVMLNREEEKIKNLLQKFIDTRNQLYGYNIIYPKYRNMVAVSSFCDYLLSGRCSMLEGSDGAYNLFENESRNDIIITKLSDVVDSLAKIQNNQYMLYEKLSKIEAGINNINSSMDRAINILHSTEMTVEQITKILDSIENNTAEIKANTDVIAHYSEITAYYSKKNADLTNALGYLVALK